MNLNWFGVGLGPALVLKKFEYDKTGGTVHIKGRRPGIMAFVYSAMGLDATTSFDVEPREISYRSASLSGEDHTSVPTPCVATLSCGFNKPVGYLVEAVLGLVAGIYLKVAERMDMALFAGLLFFAICIAAYFLSKKIYISVRSNGGNMVSIRFKRSVIENVSVDIDKVKDIIALMRTNVIKSHGGIVMAVDSSPAGKICPKCGVQLGTEDAFCGECGARL